MSPAREALRFARSCARRLERYEADGATALAQVERVSIFTWILIAIEERARSRLARKG